MSRGDTRCVELRIGTKPRGRGAGDFGRRASTARRQGGLVTGAPAGPRESFEGKGTPRGKVGRRRRSAVGSKPGEPHDRLRGATNPRSRVRRKPPKSGGTTRAERVRVWQSRTSGNREWTHAGIPVEGRSLRNSMRGARDGIDFGRRRRGQRADRSLRRGGGGCSVSAGGGSCPASALAQGSLGTGKANDPQRSGAPLACKRPWHQPRHQPPGGPLEPGTLGARL